MDPTKRSEYLPFQEAEEQMRAVRDHLHWLAVHRRFEPYSQTAEYAEAVADALLRMIYGLRGEIGRAERGRFE